MTPTPCLAFLCIMSRALLANNTHLHLPLQVLDDVLVKWSNLTHAFGLQLVRWTTLEYFVVMPLDLSEKKRPLVRAMADTLMAMVEDFRCAPIAPIAPFLHGG